MFMITINDEAITDDESSSRCPVARTLCSTGHFEAGNICIHITPHLQINFLLLSLTLAPRLPLPRLVMNNIHKRKTKQKNPNSALNSL